MSQYCTVLLWLLLALTFNELNGSTIKIPLYHRKKQAKSIADYFGKLVDPIPLPPFYTLKTERHLEPLKNYQNV
uniref:Uncharacterized protein n=3 Tax=Rhodnius TaxID=13248 RepID=T1HEK6_RHOPR